MEPPIKKTDFCQKLTRKLYECRIAFGISRNRVRELTDIDISKIENNESNLTVFTLYLLLRFYGKSISEFFSELERDIGMEQIKCEPEFYGDKSLNNDFFKLTKSTNPINIKEKAYEKK